tara:strand:+ start:127 stop:768 length:642 start_codon:yes stop_codon:yes gene_type:complete
VRLWGKNNPDFIQVFDKVLTSDQCKHIIKYLDSQEKKLGVVGAGEVNIEIKECWEVFGDFSNPNWVDSLLAEKLSEYIPLYRSMHPELDNQVQKWRLDPRYNMKKYDPGKGYYGKHCETESVCSAFRMLVWMFYFNTVTDKGGTIFDNYDKIIDAIEGRLVIWPSYWTHIHRGIVSNTQTKYIASGWYSFALDSSEVQKLNGVLKWSKQFLIQ